MFSFGLFNVEVSAEEDKDKKDTSLSKIQKRTQEKTQRKTQNG